MIASTQHVIKPTPRGALAGVLGSLIYLPVMLLLQPTPLARIAFAIWPGLQQPAGEFIDWLLHVALVVGTQTYAKIRQNLLWAFFFNAVGIPIAAMAASTLGILLNSFGLRLSRLATFSVPALDVRPTTAQPAVDGVAVQD